MKINGYIHEQFFFKENFYKNAYRKRVKIVGRNWVVCSEIVVDDGTLSITKSDTDQLAVYPTAVVVLRHTQRDILD